MAVARRKGTINVVQAARQRILNVFRNGLPVYMSFSGGKDSLVLAGLVMALIREGLIDPSQLTVQFVDEEAIFPCIEKTVLEWRKRFLLAGAKFEWFCVEVKHFNCFNELSNDETFICWDRAKEAVWIRRPPAFAIRSHPLLKPRIDAYQDWMPRVGMDGITIVGIRTAESIQRLKNIAMMNHAGKRITERQQIFPIYDWSNNDVWLYLLNENIEIPDIYLYLWQAGVGKGQLRVSQFFSIDTARSLVKMDEFYPDLMERIVRREPNAYLASLYWDSEMFGRTTKKRKDLEGEDEKNYRDLITAMLNDIDGCFTTSRSRKIANRYRNFFIQFSSVINAQECKMIYQALVAGDPKLRTFRAIYARLFGRHIKESKEERDAKNEH